MVSLSFRRFSTGIRRRISSAAEMRAEPGGGFRADIDDVRALLFEFHGAGEGAVGVGVLAAVGKRIGRDVQHAHSSGALAEGDFALL